MVCAACEGRWRRFPKAVPVRTTPTCLHMPRTLGFRESPPVEKSPDFIVGWRDRTVADVDDADDLGPAVQIASVRTDAEAPMTIMSVWR